MRQIFLSILTFLFFSSFTSAQFNSYYSQNFLGLASPGALKYGLNGSDNPALLALIESPEVTYLFTNDILETNINQWGLFFAVPHIGYSVTKSKIRDSNVTDMKLSLGFGNSTFSFGGAYGWSAGNAAIFNRTDLFTLGLMYRPGKYFSIGYSQFIPVNGNGSSVIDIGVRPFGNEFLTLFFDYMGKSDEESNINYFTQGQPGLKERNKWSTGAVVEPLPGLRLTGRYFENGYYNAGIQLSFGHASISSQFNFDDEGKGTHSVVGIRVGGYDRNPFSEPLNYQDNYVEMDLLGRVKYQKFILFDDSKTLLGLIKQINAAKDDPTVSGIALNTSGMTINKEMVWELREKLLEFRNSGKKVIAFLDNADIDKYHLASAADKIIMDPLAVLVLEGYLMGRTFIKGTLDKIGIGFNEWRYFKYKSAYENFSRQKMSAGDVEQRQALVDAYYYLAKNDIIKSRSFSGDKFDDLIDNKVLFTSSEALSEGLIDGIGRWEQVKEMVKDIEGEEKGFIDPGSLSKFHLPSDNRWGKKPEIAIIYALGICAMDEGINARELVKDVERAAENSNVKAIILRVDSPGGDGIASDYIAEALKKAKGKKPVIVSQGYVAASGGYWLSMYADTILAAPNTITGSIGVIGGWFYNTELKDKLGITTDYVKKGEHADVGFGFSIPFLNTPFLPDRDLTEEEQEKIDKLILNSYEEFVAKVAAGRSMTIDEIKTIAQGRVWSGYDGKKNGLIDLIGGLDAAINIAGNKAGLKADEFDIIEYPAPSFFDFNLFIPKFFGIEQKENPIIKNLLFRFKNNGKIMPILPVEDMDMMPIE